MEASLFRRRPVRRGWMILMAVGSLLVHSALVGLGYVLWQPISAPIEVPTTEVKLDDGDNDVRELIVPFDAPTPPPDMPTPPPDETPPPDDTPPPTEEPQMDEPDQPTPTPKPKTDAKRYAATPAPPNAKRGPVPQTGVVGGNPNGTKATGTPGPGKGGSWTSPHPPYPAAARAAHVQGTTSLTYTTDASGNVSNVTITQRAGNAILDHQTESYVRSNWHGPPNSTHSTTFEYKLQ